MKNLNGRAHNACYRPYYHQSLHFAQQQQLQLQQQHLHQQPEQQMLRQQRQLPTQPAYQQQQQQQQHHQQQQQQQEQQQQLRQSFGNNNAANNCFTMRNSNSIGNGNAYGNIAAYANNSNTSTDSNSNSNSNGNCNAAAMAAMCQMQNFFSQHQQEYNNNNNNCSTNNYYQQQQQPQQQQQQQEQQQHGTIPTTAATCTDSGATKTENNDHFAMDASEIASFLASELFMQQLGTFDGIQLAPTLTTPTLTPTTTRSLQEAFFELTNDPGTPYQATFKPPPLGLMPGGNNGNGVTNVPTTTATATVVGVVNPMISQLPYEVNNALQGTDSDNSNASWADAQNNEDQDTTDTSSAHTDSTSYQNGHMAGSSVNGGGANNFTNVLAGINAGRGSSQGSNTNTSNSATPARRGGGRRPNRNTNMSPEEEEKRRIRRERNKQAAARCRKRRVDQTNELTYEVEQLEKKGDGLKKEVETLTEVKNQLEFFLRAHHSSCQKIRTDLLSVTTCNGLIAPVGLPSAGSCDSGSSSHHNNNSNDSSNGTITGLDATLNSTGRSNSPLDLKPQIKDEPLDGGQDSSCLLDQDGPPPSKRFPLPPMSTLMTPTGVSSGSLQTPIASTAPGGFGSAYPITTTKGSMNSPTLNELNKPKERPNTLAVQRPFVPQMHLNLTSNHNKMPGSGPTHIQGVPIQTPTTGFNFDSLMDGGTGLTPVSGPLVPSQNKHPLELPTPTAEPSKLVSL
ncbi:hypothetical protein KR067_010926 [Drosophila pandora]|nr:hypothetical protein KR067_010926 [Drosophila pandora]